MNVLEMHTWNSRAADVERPDRLVIDLDPGEAVGWRAVVAAAKQVRDLFAALDLESFVKTTGGRGLHVVVPIVPRPTGPNAWLLRARSRWRWCGGGPIRSPSGSPRRAGPRRFSSTTCATTGQTRRSPPTRPAPARRAGIGADRVE
jgi:hypothetical protein